MDRTARSPRAWISSVALLLVGLTHSGCGDLLVPSDQATAPAQSTQGLDGPGLVQFGGISYVVALDGNRAWLGLGPRVVGLDITRPEAPLPLTQSPVLPGVVLGLAPDSAAGLVWAALGDGGVVALRTADGADLAVARQVDLDAPARDVAVWADHVYVAQDPADLVVLDAAGELVGRYASPASPGVDLPEIEEPKLGLEVRDGMAFLATGEAGLDILAVSDPTAPRLLGHLATPDTVVDVALDGDLAYLAGYPLRVVDVSEPANPRVVWPQGADGTGLDDPLVAFGVAIENGLWVSNQLLVDVHTPERPAVAAALPGAGEGNDHSRPAVRDGIAYLPAGERAGGLRILDVSDPAAPRELWRASAPGWVMSLTAAGGRIEALGGEATTVDVHAPAEPRVLGQASDRADTRWQGWNDGRTVETDTHTFEAADRTLRVWARGPGKATPSAAPTAAYTLTIQSNPTEMVRQGDFLFLTDSGWDYDIMRGGPKYFEVVDISDAERPRVAASLDFEYPLDAIAVAGDTAWVAHHGSNEPGIVIMGEEHLPSEVVAIDIGNPTAPQVRDRIRTTAMVMDLLVAGQTLYAATDQGWQTFDVGDDGTRLQPGESRSLPDGAWQMALVDGMLWFAGGNAGVLGVALGPPAPQLAGAPPRLPVLAQTGAAAVPAATATPMSRVAAPDSGHMPLVGHVGGPPRVMTLAGTRLYVGQARNVFGLDITDPLHPRFLGRSPLLAGDVVDLAPGDGHVFAALAGAGLQAVDATDPLRIVPTADGFVPGQADLVALSGDRLFAVDADSGALRVLDVSVPARPRPVANLDTGGPVLGLTAAGAYAYLAQGRAGLTVIDARDPAKPMVVGRLNDGLLATAVAVIGNHAYVVDGRRTLVAVDVADATLPRRVGRLDLAPGISRLRSFDGRLALLNPESPERLQWVDVSDPTRPRVDGSAGTHAGWGRQDVSVRQGVALFLDAEQEGLYTAVLAPGGQAIAEKVGRGDEAAVGILTRYVFQALPGDDYSAIDTGELTHLIGHSPAEAPYQAGVLPVMYRHQAVAGHYLLVSEREEAGGLKLYDLAAKGGPTLMLEAPAQSAGSSPSLGYPPPPPMPTALPKSASRLVRVRYPAPKRGWDNLERELVSLLPASLAEGAAPEAVFDIGTGEYASDPVYSARDETRGLLVTGGPTLRVFDISVAPARELAALPLAGDSPVALYGGYAYRIAKSNEIQIIDLHQPSAPRIAATLTPSGLANAISQGVPISAAHGFLYILEYDPPPNSGEPVVRVYDLADPLAPRPVDTLATGASPGIMAIHAAGDRLYVIGRNGESVFRNARVAP